MDLIHDTAVLEWDGSLAHAGTVPADPDALVVRQPGLGGGDAHLSGDGRGHLQGGAGAPQTAQQAIAVSSACRKSPVLCRPVADEAPVSIPSVVHRKGTPYQHEENL